MNQPRIIILSNCRLQSINLVPHKQTRRMAMDHPPYESDLIVLRLASGFHLFALPVEVHLILIEAVWVFDGPNLLADDIVVRL